MAYLYFKGVSLFSKFFIFKNGNGGIVEYYEYEQQNVFQKPRRKIIDIANGKSNITILYRSTSQKCTRKHKQWLSRKNLDWYNSYQSLCASCLFNVSRAPTRSISTIEPLHYLVYTWYIWYWMFLNWDVIFNVLTVAHAGGK